MGLELKKSAPPLPAPTETETDTGSGMGTELATDLSRVTDKTSYSIPEDGSPVTIATRRKKEKHDKEAEGLTRTGHKSQTSLLIEYFEGGKGSTVETRRPSVRVKVTPSGKSRSRSANEHIQITETKGNRKPSYTKRINLSSPNAKGDRVLEADGDTKSVSSYASVTEESNLTSRSGHPVEIEVMRRPRSPLIPTDLGVSSNIQPLGSDVSSMPADSFLDGKARSPERKRSQSFTKGEALAAGAVGGLAAAAVADNLKTASRRRSRSFSPERVAAHKAAEKVRIDKSERRPKHRESRSRSVSNSEKTSESIKSPRRRSSRSHVEDSLVSGADSSQLTTSRVSDNKSFRSGTSKSSINNPKLLETVEDAIRRLILPELTALKKEQNEQKAMRNREKLERDRRGSITPGSSGISRESREDSTSRRHSGHESPRNVARRSKDRELLSSPTGKVRKERRHDRTIEDDSPRSSRRGESEETAIRDEEHSRGGQSAEKRSGLGALAASIGLGGLTAAALHKHNSKEVLDERQERRRRRKDHSRNQSVGDNHAEAEQGARMPMMSDINPSELTRTSILSAETERPRSASDEYRTTPIREVPRGIASPASVTPTRSPHAQNLLHLQHGNRSQHNLTDNNQPRHEQEYELDERGRKIPMSASHERDVQGYGKEHNAGRDAEAVAAGAAVGAILEKLKHPSRQQEPDYEEYEEDGYYQDQQEVPSPLRYVPYNQDKRGLSPIPQSVYSYREENEQNRDSRTTRSTASYSTLDRSPQHKGSAPSVLSDPTNPRRHDFAEVRHGGLTDSELTQNQDDEYWDEQHMENDKNRDIDLRSYRSSDAQTDYKHRNNYAEDGVEDPLSDKVTSGQAVRGIGANPDYVHTPVGVESAVASLISASVLTGDSGRSALERRASFASYEDGSERNFTSRGHSPSKQGEMSRDVGYDASALETMSQENSPSRYPEYELDEHGRKITMPDYKTSSRNAAEAALTGAAAGAITAALHEHSREAEDQGQPQYQERREETGAPLQKSFKDRTMDLQGEPRSPRHSLDRMIGEDERPDDVKMVASAIPDAHDPMPEIGYRQDEGSDVTTNPSVIHGPIGETARGNQDNWHIKDTSPQPQRGNMQTRRSHEGSGLREAELGLLDAATGAGVAAALAGHNRETGHDHDEEWQRTSEDRKRDTLVTNPYEGQSPIAMGQDRHIPGLDYGGQQFGYANESPLAMQKDEGYISAPNARSPGAVTQERRAKGVGFIDNAGMGTNIGHIDEGDPFYSPKHGRHFSGMSHGMDSQYYDSATGNGVDRIQSKDIVALMDHLTVRDAQRSARDTEILVTLVRAAAEMRNSFEDMKRLLADTEDVIITEVERNTDRSVQKVINGPRPPPASTNRSARASQDEIYDDIPNKKRNVFRRALKGLSMKSSNDLGKIEDMLVQLLGEVEGLKLAQSLPRNSNDKYDDDGQEGGYEQDRGYDPEGLAGTSTASHASQSGQFSRPISRGASVTRGFDGRKFSENRISTVPEGDEEEVELEPHEQAVLETQFENMELLTPVRENIRAGSAPLDTSPQHYIPPASLSNENTPRTDKSKKHKSSSSSGWIPRISRWSETTASTVAKPFRSSGRNSGRRDAEAYDQPRSRSGSDLGNYDPMHNDPYGEDKLHSGFSQEQLPNSQSNSPYQPTAAEGPRELTGLLPPEDPKYKAHRNSLNLQHPQPRPGPTHRYQTALEVQAQDFNSPMSPKSLDWGSSTSVNRLPANQNQNQNRYSNQTGDGQSTLSGGYNSPLQSGGLPPARPPKEPLNSPGGMRTNRLSKPSPLAHEHLSSPAENRYSNGSASQEARASGIGMTYGQSPRSLSAALGVPARKPTGPRSMGSPRGSNNGAGSGEELARNKNRDTFGTIASHHSGESEIF
ncbi:MAG: hypothetical protein M1818_006329 [Claussenomyces sp. TS43310]|nr:MAG: hypothetical protein M1818_006329 [Claussenomyces sp. TS43310]